MKYDFPCGTSEFFSSFVDVIFKLKSYKAASVIYFFQNSETIAINLNDL